MEEELVEDLKLIDENSFSNKFSLDESFSVIYARAYRVASDTNYMLSGNIQGSTRVYIDEELVFDRWENGNHQVNSKIF
ncbi:hypothetical protein ACI2OX_19745 [Bacillus sp. N9]